LTRGEREVSPGNRGEDAAGLGVDGRIGVTAIAPTPAEADAMYEAVRVAIDTLVIAEPDGAA
jgi:hypothetical protein